MEETPRPLLHVCRLLNEHGSASELTPDDFVENIVVKIADEVVVAVSTLAWKLTCAAASANAQYSEIDGVRIPYLSLPDLILSKQTYREQDRVDIKNLCQRLI